MPERKIKRIKVESCWGGGERFSFRLTFPDGSRESISGDTWTRKTASQALDIAEHVYGYDRRNVRFEVR